MNIYFEIQTLKCKLDKYQIYYYESYALSHYNLLYHFINETKFSSEAHMM